MTQKTNNRFIIIAGRTHRFKARHLSIGTFLESLFYIAYPAYAQHVNFLRCGLGHL